MKKLLSLILFPLSCIAHPHAFIDIQTKVLVEKEQLKGFSMQWTLDEASSASVLYDLTHASKPSTKQQLINEAMSNIVYEHYFSYLFDKNNKKIKYQTQPQNYGMNSNGRQVTYYFDFLLSKPQLLKENHFILMTYDPTYFVAMAYPKKSAVDFSSLPTQCLGKVVEPNVNNKIRDYAASLDRSQRDEDRTLGEMFSQKLEILCH